jgi:hypothetical protein
MCDFAQTVFCKNTLFALLRLYFLAAQNYLQEEKDCNLVFLENILSSGLTSFSSFEYPGYIKDYRK